MRPRTLFLYVALLVVPALVIGVLAIRWIRREDERLRIIARQALEQQSAVMAGHLELLLSDITEGLLHDLAEIAEDDTDRLYRWRAAHPLVRNVFVWTRTDSLDVPDSRWPDLEERTFLPRYDALFSGRRSWPDPAADTEDSPAAVPTPRVTQTRQEAARRRPIAGPEGLARQLPDATGWLPWFWEHDLHLLGWARYDGGERMRGLELELLAVLARFQPFFASVPDRRVAYALSDHHGALLMRTDGYDEARAEAAADTARQPVGTLLPNWHVQAAAMPSSGAAASFVVLASMLAGTLLLSMLAGGALLLWQSRRDFRDALRKTTFVSNVSHELKTPLTTIRMYAEMLAQDRVTEEPRRRAYVGVIAAESARLTRLVNNVLDFSRLEQGRKTYHREPIDLANWLRDAIATHRDRIEAAGLRIELRVPEQPVIVRGDRDALDQVLLNLLDNAVKYAAAGGSLSIAVEQDAAWIRIAVADRGAGIPRDQAARIFESFYRVDDSLTTRVPGSGLGLSIGRRLMRDLGGDLTFTPRDGGGAIFDMRFQGEDEDA